ncbi:hypothetical protein QAD02_003323 [Eretmocerus hayati]|uniref:Uncharacterized protein n=1 Tax=Eretmocerus hayati TaxID=131215 RepID=A0ACC2NP19_9HYME|nr:hypothetical protein QAD02_003323 [Eretmocerus hayati]
MHEKYYKHWSMFVYGVTLCCQEFVSADDRALADQAFTLFVQGIEPLYGKTFMRHNVHLALHVVKYVKMYGALWAWSAFPFENFNGILATLVHSSQYVAHQICKLTGRLTYLRNDAGIFTYPGVSDKAKNLFMYFTGKSKIVRIIEHVSGLKLLGFGKPDVLSLVEKVAIENSLQHSMENDYFKYDRFINNSILYTSTSYTRSKERSNHTVVMSDGVFINILSLAAVKSCEIAKKSYVVLGEKLERLNDTLLLREPFNSGNM